MKEQLTIEHLAPYLPYRLKIYCTGDETIYDLMEVGIYHMVVHREFAGMGYLNYNSEEIEWYKPILRPMSDLTKPITVEGYNNGKEFVPISELGQIIMSRQPEAFDYQKEAEVWVAILIKDSTDFDDVFYWIIKLLYLWHFDVGGFIEKGLAIDINTLKV